MTGRDNVIPDRTDLADPDRAQAARMTSPGVAEAQDHADLKVQCRTRVPLPLRMSDATTIPAVVVTFTGLPAEHVALLVGDWQAPEPLVRIHSECLTGDVFSSARCDCGPQLQQALRLMCTSGGIVLYLRQEGRGIGLYNKIDAYGLQDQGYDTYEANLALNFGADERDFFDAAAMLQALGVRRCELLSNNPQKRDHLQAGGVQVAKQRPTGVFVTSANVAYLRSKATKAGHLMDVTEPAPDISVQPAERSTTLEAR